MRSPLQWLLHAALLLLAAAIVLQLAVSLLTHLLPWIVGLGVVVGGGYVGWRIRDATRRRW